MDPDFILGLHSFTIDLLSVYVMPHTRLWSYKVNKREKVVGEHPSPQKDQDYTFRPKFLQNTS